MSKDKTDLNSPEVKAAIKAAVDEATEGLANKNKELLGELKQARKGQEIKPEQLEALEAERDEAQEALKQSQKELKKAQADLKTASESLEGESNFTKSLLIDNGLTSELTKAGVTNPALLKAAVALHKGSVTIEADGDSRVAKVGDKSLSDHLKEWAGSDEGKNFVSAQNNSGGGANGGGGEKPDQKTVTRSEFDSMNQAQRSEFSKGGGKVIDAAA